METKYTECLFCGRVMMNNREQVLIHTLRKHSNNFDIGIVNKLNKELDELLGV